MRRQKRTRRKSTCHDTSNHNGRPTLVFASKGSVLSGDNLNKRHRQLNGLVNEAVKNKVNFEDLKDTPERTDPDRLFKIDLAARTQNIDYLIENLKCGDSLYITRVLNKSCLYNDVYRNIINPDYLEQHIFPLMSLKMKKKTLSNVLKNVKNADRAASFYEYCLSQNQDTMAFKFLLFTSESYKILNVDKTFGSKREYLLQFVGISWSLFDIYLKQFRHTMTVLDMLLLFHHMYNVSEDKYLNLLINGVPKYTYTYQTTFGLRMSIDIMKKHKAKVLNNPHSFVPVLKTNILLKYTSVKDSKIYLEKLMPNESKKFWNFYLVCNHIVGVIPFEERYAYLKKIFTEKYPSEEFDLSEKFYSLQFYEMMTDVERENWALRHIASKKEILGVGNEYKWYKFVKFEKAFENMIKLITTTQDVITRRNMNSILLEATKTQNELKSLLKYYCQKQKKGLRKQLITKDFLKEVMILYNVFSFDGECWDAFTYLIRMHFHNTEWSTYRSQPYQSDWWGDIDPWDNNNRSISIEKWNIYRFTPKSFYHNVALIYYALHKLRPLRTQRHYAIHYLRHLSELHAYNLDTDQLNTVYNFLLQIYSKYIKTLERRVYNKEMQYRIREYLTVFTEILFHLEISYANYPELLKKYMNLDYETFSKIIDPIGNVEKESEPEYNVSLGPEYIPKKYLSQRHLIRLLKSNISLFLAEMKTFKSEIMRFWYVQNIKMNELIRKLKVYFADDVASYFLRFCLDLILDKECTKPQIYAGVAGLFQLASDEFKIDFITSYTPEDPKIIYDSIDETTWHIQESICRFACYSRKPLPLSKILMFIKGDYLKYCMPIFNYYLAHLPLPQSTAFIEEILKRPLSVQKHGIRLAFQSFNLAPLRNLVLRIWKRSKNISLRMLLYQSMYKIIKSNKPNDEFFEIFVNMTLDVHEEDDESVFHIMTHPKIHDAYLPRYLETVWVAFEKMPEQNIYLEYRTKIIEHIILSCVTRIHQEVIFSIITSHAHTILKEEGKIVLLDDDVQKLELNKAKWRLTKRYLVSFNDDRMKTNLEILDFIMARCLDQWNQSDEGAYNVQQFLTDFIYDLLDDYGYYVKTLYINPIFEKVLTNLLQKLPLHEIYMTVWYFHLTIISERVLNDARIKSGDNKERVTDFAKAFVSLVEGFVDRNEYYEIFVKQIAETVQIMLLKLEILYDEYLEKKSILDTFVITLISADMSQLTMIALWLLPSTRYSRYIFEEINTYDNEEMKTIVYEKIKEIPW